MSNPILASTLQSALLGTISNIIAQVITSRRNQISENIDWVQVIQFVLFTIVSTPPNVLWQEFLESTWPAYPTTSTSLTEKTKTKPKPKLKPKDGASTDPPVSLSYRNTVVKMVLDQTLGATVNTILFSTFIRSIRAATAHAPHGLGLHKTVLWWTGAGAMDFGAVDFAQVWGASMAEFRPIITDGWKFWPIISLISFTAIKTVQMRNLFGATAGIAWNIYLCIVTAD